MLTKQKQYEAIEKKINEENENIQKKIEQCSNNLTKLDIENKKNQEQYELSIRRQLPPMQQNLNKANSYNKAIYELEYKKNIDAIDAYKKSIELNQQYLTRIKIYLEYFKSVISIKPEEQINKIKYYYQLLNAIQSELLNTFQLQLTIYNNKILFNNDVIALIRDCSIKRCGDIEYLYKQVTPFEKMKEITAKRDEVVKEIEKYKNVFRNEKFDLNEEAIFGDVMMKNNVISVIDSIYFPNLSKNK